MAVVVEYHVNLAVHVDVCEVEEWNFAWTCIGFLSHVFSLFRIVTFLFWLFVVGFGIGCLFFLLIASALIFGVRVGGIKGRGLR